jgi:hypothetical protein
MIIKTSNSLFYMSEMTLNYIPLKIFNTVGQQATSWERRDLKEWKKQKQ